MNEDTSTRPVPPILHRKKADLVYEYLREQIINGTYAPGRRMTLADLSGELGLSHMPVREALLRLEREGLLVSEPHRYARCAAVAAGRAGDLSRSAASSKGSPPTRRHGPTMPTSCPTSAPSTPISPMPTSGRIIPRWVRPTGCCTGVSCRRPAARSSPASSRTTDGVAAYRSGYQLIPGRAKHTVAEHQAIIDAIEARDPDAARDAARAHIQKAGAELAIIVARQREE